MQSGSFFVDIVGDAVFEAEEWVVVSLSRPSKLTLPEPFMSDKIESPPDSIVNAPDDDRILFHLPTTTIVIRSGSLLLKGNVAICKNVVFSCS